MVWLFSFWRPEPWFMSDLQTLPILEGQDADGKSAKWSKIAAVNEMIVGF